MEKLNAIDKMDAHITRVSDNSENVKAQGIYTVKCFDKDGKLKWEDTIKNVVTDVGANLMLDTFLGGSANSTYFLGLISSIGWSAVAVGNTMGSHAGWNEAGNGVNYPNWSTPASNGRETITWAAAGSRSKALSANASFTFATNGGTLKGCFIVTGSGAVSTNASTAGTLYSCGTFTGGDKIVAILETLTVSYATSV
jgi:hypothetical protein